MWHQTFMSKTLAPQKTSSPPVTECSQSSFSTNHETRAAAFLNYGALGALRP